MSFEERLKLSYDTGQRSYEEEIVKNATMSDINMELLEEYKQILKSKSSYMDILTARGLVRDGKITKACILLFGRNPSKFLPQARFRFLRYDGITAETGSRLNLIKDEFIDGAIPEIIVKSRDLLNSQLRNFQYLDNKDGKFKIIAEYPEFAWFEGIVNALTHRDYSFSGDYIRVTMYDDRLEIFSPGALPNIVTLDNMLTTRYARNSRIARTLTEFGWVRELNEGVKRIYEEMERYLLKDPGYEELNGNALRLILENNIVQRRLRKNEKMSELLDEKDISKLSEDELLIVSYLYPNRKITTKIGAEILNRSFTHTRNCLKKLEEEKILKWYGTSTNDPKQYYKLNKS